MKSVYASLRWRAAANVNESRGNKSQVWVRGFSFFYMACNESMPWPRSGCGPAGLSLSQSNNIISNHIREWCWYSAKVLDKRFLSFFKYSFYSDLDHVKKKVKIFRNLNILIYLEILKSQQINPEAHTPHLFHSRCQVYIPGTFFTAFDSLFWLPVRTHFSVFPNNMLVIWLVWKQISMLVTGGSFLIPADMLGAVLFYSCLNFHSCFAVRIWSVCKVLMFKIWSDRWEKQPHHKSNAKRLNGGTSRINSVD